MDRRSCSRERGKGAFPDAPDRPDHQEIKDSIRQNGDVLQCPYVTHTKPDPDAEIVYLATFDIPERFTRLKLFAPCPVCSSNHRKFGSGKIAWSPGEGVIRLIGPDCFKTLNKEEHERAQRVFELYEQRRRAIAYLVKSAGLLREAGFVVAGAMVVAEAIDDFNVSFRNTVQERLAMAVWENTKDGYLFVWRRRRDLSGRTGEIRETSEQAVYARVVGVNVLKPNVRKYAREMQQIIEALARLDNLDRWRENVAAMSDAELDEACRLLNKAISAARLRLDEMRELQRFVETININTLNRWGSQPETACPMFIERRGSIIRVGRQANALISVQIPPNFEGELPRIQAPLFKEIEVDPENLELANDQSNTPHAA